jgi:hypothetical protein
LRTAGNEVDASVIPIIAFTGANDNNQGALQGERVAFIEQTTADSAAIRGTVPMVGASAARAIRLQRSMERRMSRFDGTVLHVTM